MHHIIHIKSIQLNFSSTLRVKHKRRYSYQELKGRAQDREKLGWTHMLLGHMLPNSAVYTGIKKPESFSHSGFSLKVARQLPLNTPKNPNRKTHLRSVIFWNSAKISLVFCQCKRSLQSRRYYSGFWSRGTWPSVESPDRGPRRNAHYTCTVKGREKSRMRTTYQNTSMRFRVFSRMRFSCQKPRMLWVFLAV